VAMRSDLVAVVADRGAGVRIALDDPGGYEECAADAEPLEEAEDTRRADGRTVAQLGHQREVARQLRILAERGGLAVHVEADHRGAARAVWPDEARRRSEAVD